MNPTPSYETLDKYETECPMCGYDSLRHSTWFREDSNGGWWLINRTTCGRCVADMRRLEP